MSPALCQAEARRMTMWISIPHTRSAELCPVAPNHQQSACRCSYTHTHILSHYYTATWNSRHTHGHVNFYNDPFPELQFSPQAISTRDISTADTLMEQKLGFFSVCLCSLSTVKPNNNKRHSTTQTSMTVHCHTQSGKCRRRVNALQWQPCVFLLFFLSVSSICASHCKAPTSHLHQEYALPPFSYFSWKLTAKGAFEKEGGQSSKKVSF